MGNEESSMMNTLVAAHNSKYPLSEDHAEWIDCCEDVNATDSEKN